MIFAKFEFRSKEEFVNACSFLLFPDTDLSTPVIQGQDCCIRHGINIELSPSVLDESGNIETPALRSSLYHVDICFSDLFGEPKDALPDKIAVHEVFPKPSGQHEFMGMASLYEERYSHFKQSK